MPSFSHRRGAPSCRQPEDCTRAQRGCRPGTVPTCYTRLKGWIKNVAARSPIWGDVDLKAFCRLTGYSREHAMRELSKIRAEGDFAFETKLRTKRGIDGRRWGIIVADPEKLRFDKHSLFFDQNGSPHHNYTTLGNGGKKIEPTITPLKSRRGRPLKAQPARPARKSSRGRPRKKTQPVPAPLPIQAPTPNPMIIPLQPEVSPAPSEKSAENTRLCDIPHKDKDSSGIQPQKNQYGAERSIALELFFESEPGASRRPPALRKKAFVIADELENCHWENCKVIYHRGTAFSLVIDSLADGHDHERIISCYSKALFVCHGYAVDLAARTGQIRSFNLSSTVVKARQLLSADGLTRLERIARWYRNHFRPEADVIPANVDPAELARIHAQIAATFPDDPEAEAPVISNELEMVEKSYSRPWRKQERAEECPAEIEPHQSVPTITPDKPPVHQRPKVEPAERPVTDQERAEIAARVRRMFEEFKVKMGVGE